MSDGALVRATPLAGPRALLSEKKWRNAALARNECRAPQKSRPTMSGSPSALTQWTYFAATNAG